MTKDEIKKIRDDVVKIIDDSKATFFGNSEDSFNAIPVSEWLYELKASICTNVEMYFYYLQHPDEKDRHSKQGIGVRVGERSGKRPAKAVQTIPKQ